MTPPAPEGFSRLHPLVQHHIVNSLGWPGLRPLQEQSVLPLTRGDDALLLAPTAGGKTEAAISANRCGSTPITTSGSRFS